MAKPLPLLQVYKLNITCTLQGGHRAPVTAIRWYESYHHELEKAVYIVQLILHAVCARGWKPCCSSGW
jgi:hypothetical protein